MLKNSSNVKVRDAVAEMNVNAYKIRRFSFDGKNLHLRGELGNESSGTFTPTMPKATSIELTDAQAATLLNALETKLTSKLATALAFDNASVA
jgi:hypothetical protein